MKSVWISPTTQNSLKIAGRGLLSSGIKIKKVNLTQNRKPLQISMEKEKKKKKRYQLVWEREAGGFFTVALEHEQCQGKFTWLP